LIFFENEKLKKEIEELKAKLAVTENESQQSKNQSNPHCGNFETKLQEQINECISDRNEITKSITQYIQSFESGD